MTTFSLPQRPKHRLAWHRQFMRDIRPNLVGITVLVLCSITVGITAMLLAAYDLHEVGTLVLLVGIPVIVAVGALWAGGTTS